MVSSYYMEGIMEVSYLSSEMIDRFKDVLTQNGKIHLFEDDETPFETAIGNSNVYYIEKENSIVAYCVVCEGYILADLHATQDSDKGVKEELLIKHIQTKYEELHIQGNSISESNTPILIANGFEDVSEAMDSENYWVWESDN